MGKVRMKYKKIYDEEKNEWMIQRGDVVFYENKLWVVRGIYATLIHQHTYISLFTYPYYYDGASRAKLYSWEANKIKQYWKIERKQK